MTDCGLLQCRSDCDTPAPQLRLHCVHAPHTAHWPSIATSLSPSVWHRPSKHHCWAPFYTNSDSSVDSTLRPSEPRPATGTQPATRPGHLDSRYTPHPRWHSPDTGPMAWNSLPDFIRDPTSSTDCFSRLLKTYLFARYYCIQCINDNALYKSTHSLTRFRRCCDILPPPRHTHDVIHRNRKYIMYCSVVSGGQSHGHK